MSFYDGEVFERKPKGEKVDFPIVEIFDSIEGEGKRAGEMSIFIRLAGCNLRCRWCDTLYSLKKEDAAESLSEEELIGRVKEYPWKNITLTGGEPLIHDCLHVCRNLAELGYEVNIETNGAVPLLPYRPDNLFYSMDWKCPDSGMNNSMEYENLWRLNKNDVLKFVVCSQRDLLEVCRIHNTYLQAKEKRVLTIPRFFISPVWGKIKPVEIVEYMKARRMDYARLQLQLHKIVWKPEERGV